MYYVLDLQSERVISKHETRAEAKQQTRQNKRWYGRYNKYKVLDESEAAIFIQRHANKLSIARRARALPSDSAAS